jgi:hypothetical protein
LINETLQLDPQKAILQLKINVDSHRSAWQAAAFPSLRLPPQIECIKGNFDVAIRDNFVVAVTVISDSSVNYIINYCSYVETALHLYSLWRNHNSSFGLSIGFYYWVWLF